MALFVITAVLIQWYTRRDVLYVRNADRPNADNPIINTTMTKGCSVLTTKQPFLLYP